jgi:hypothetical protein
MEHCSSTGWPFNPTDLIFLYSSQIKNISGFLHIPQSYCGLCPEIEPHINSAGVKALIQEKLIGSHIESSTLRSIDNKSDHSFGLKYHKNPGAQTNLF